MLLNQFTAARADWGGAIVWRVAMWHPEVIEKLIVMAGPHPNLFLSNMDADQKRRCVMLHTWLTCKMFHGRCRLTGL